MYNKFNLIENRGRACNSQRTEVACGKNAALQFSVQFSRLLTPGPIVKQKTFPTYPAKGTASCLPRGWPTAHSRAGKCQPALHIGRLTGLHGDSQSYVNLSPSAPAPRKWLLWGKGQCRSFLTSWERRDVSTCRMRTPGSLSQNPLRAGAGDRNPGKAPHSPNTRETGAQGMCLLSSHSFKHV